MFVTLFIFCHFDNQEASCSLSYSALLFLGCLQGSEIFRNTDFNGDGNRDNIQFGVQQLLVDTTPPASGTTFANEFLGVEAFLNAHSMADYSDYCLAYRFTHRDFEAGVVGLAYVAAQPPSNNAGGICEDARTIAGKVQTLNTGIVTSLNYGRRIPSSLLALTFAHECGHNFGSNVSCDKVVGSGQ